MENFIILLMWYMSGVWSFIYWWTKEYNFTYSELSLSLLMGLTGPIAYFTGWMDYSSAAPTPDTIIFKKKINKA